MNKRNALFVIAVGLLVATPAAAQVNVAIQLPGVRFELPPPLVIVRPGVQVVPDYDDEVFFHDGWYWTRQQDNWYRTRDHRGGWVVVHHQHVPVPMRELPPGHYKRYRAGPRARFEAPPPVTIVRPGIHVVREQDEEIFLHNGWYWVRHESGWYRAKDHRGGWRPVEARYVPRKLNALPPGQYRHYREPPRHDGRRFGEPHGPGPAANRMPPPQHGRPDYGEHREDRGHGNKHDKHDKRHDDHRGGRH